jgi:prepilin-type N-terminal cleavage/methylation domain-containing protein/prepilin-type processing-associated H-X9-DG protein
MRNHRAFTLIELLVVIAIIAILAAILFPVFARAKEAAKKTAGLTQMKQIGTSVLMYAADYDDGVPTWNECLAQLYRDNAYEPGTCDLANRWLPQRHWDAKLSPYVKNGRPEAGDHEGIWKSPGKESYFGRSIGMNQLIMWDPAGWSLPCQWGTSTSIFSGCYFWLNLGTVEDPVNTMFVADTGSSGRYEPFYFLNGYAERFVTSYVGYGLYEWGQPWRYGKDGANYTWLDGHAKWFKGDGIYPNPNHANTLSFPLPVAIANRCSTYKYQVSTTAMKNWFRRYMVNNFGIDCSDY